MKWVVRRTLVPSSRRRRSISPMKSCRAPGSSPRAGLVEKEQVGPGQERLGELGPAREAAGEGLHPIVFSPPHPEAIEEGRGPLPERPPAHPEQVPVVDEVFKDGELGVEGRLLEDHPDAPPDGGGLPGDREAEDARPPVRRPAGGEEGGEDAEEGGLPAAVGAEDREYLGPGNGDADPGPGRGGSP